MWKTRHLKLEAAATKRMDASSSLSNSQDPSLSFISFESSSRATSAISAAHCGAVQTARSQSAGLFVIVEGGCDDAPFD